MSAKDYVKTEEALRSLTEDQRYVTQEEGTEPAYDIEYWANDEPGIYTGDYAVTDRLHHICIFVDSIEEARAAVAAAGAEVLVEGTVGADGAVMYVDPGAGPGHVIELLQNMTGADAIFQMIKDAGKDWDGSDPLRRLG